MRAVIPDEKPNSGLNHGPRTCAFSGFSSYARLLLQICACAPNLMDELAAVPSFAEPTM